MELVIFWHCWICLWYVLYFVVKIVEIASTGVSLEMHSFILRHELAREIIKQLFILLNFFKSTNLAYLTRNVELILYWFHYLFKLLQILIQFGKFVVDALEGILNPFIHIYYSLVISILWAFQEFIGSWGLFLLFLRLRCICCVYFAKHSCFILALHLTILQLSSLFLCCFLSSLMLLDIFLTSITQGNLTMLKHLCICIHLLCRTVLAERLSHLTWPLLIDYLDFAQ